MLDDLTDREGVHRDLDRRVVEGRCRDLTGVAEHDVLAVAGVDGVAAGPPKTMSWRSPVGDGVVAAVRRFGAHDPVDVRGVGVVAAQQGIAGQRRRSGRVRAACVSGRPVDVPRVAEDDVPPSLPLVSPAFATMVSPPIPPRTMSLPIPVVIWSTPPIFDSIVSTSPRVIGWVLKFAGEQGVRRGDLGRCRRRRGSGPRRLRSCPCPRRRGRCRRRRPS